ncbi:MAG: hypothetical protein GF308_04975 [Candidatus Heimdallarchaeota archaeon]|nr:hypothetical protein [Candidatus Heimdallarchaeota archaeon]
MSTLKQIYQQFRNYLTHPYNSLRRIINQMWMSLRLFVRSPLSLLLMIIYPIILLLLFGSIFTPPQNYTFDLEVQDKDNTVFSEMFIQELMASEILEIHRLSPLENPKEYMQRNGLYACLIIPNDWTINVFNPAIPVSNLTFISDPYSEKAQIVSQIVKKTINEFNLNFTETTQIVDLETEDFISESIQYIEFLVPGVIGIIIMNAGLLGTLNRQLYFKQSGIFQKLATTPITKWEYVTAEIFWEFFIALIASFLAILTAWFAFDFHWREFSFIFFPIVFTGVMLFSGIGILFSRFIKNRTAASVAGTLIMFPMIFLCGVFFDISGFPALVVISKFLPLTFIVEGLRAGMISGNYSLAWLNTGITIAIGITVFSIGSFLLRWVED